jgi:hypothetical protein
VKKLVGRTDIEDAMKKLDTLTQEEALMASAEALKVVRSVDNKMDTVIDGVQRVSPLLSSTFIILGVNQARLETQQIGNDINRS